MALVECPICSKRISSLAKQCQHCKADFAGLSDEQKQARRSIVAIKKQNNLLAQSFIAMLLFCGGVLGYFLGDHQAYPWLPLVSQIVGAIGFAWYVFLRCFAVVQKIKR